MIEDDPKVLDGPNVISNESIDLIKKDLMNPKFLMIQKELRLEVRTLIILKGILHQKIFYRLNLIFWIVMGCSIARFGRRGLKTTET